MTIISLLLVTLSLATNFWTRRGVFHLEGPATVDTLPSKCDMELISAVVCARITIDVQFELCLLFGVINSDSLCVSLVCFRRTLCCRFGLVLVQASFVNATEVRCLSPAHPEGSVAVEVSINGVDFSGNSVGTKCLRIISAS